MASDISTVLPLRTGPMTGYSAHVRIQLEVDGRVLRPSHSAPDFLIFREPQSLVSTKALLILAVDGVEHKTDVEILPYEAPASRVPIRRLAE